MHGCAFLRDVNSVWCAVSESQLFDISLHENEILLSPKRSFEFCGSFIKEIQYEKEIFFYLDGGQFY